MDPRNNKPSCSGYQSKLKAMKVPDISKLYKKVGKLLNHQESNSTFVSSPFSRSSSQDSGVPPPYPDSDFYGSAFPPLPSRNDQQMPNNPTPYGWALNGITSVDVQQPSSSTSNGMLSLDIGSGQETAGSGYDYLIDPSAESDNEIFIERQAADLASFKKFIAEERNRVLDLAKKQDNYDIWYENRYAKIGNKSVMELELEVARLDIELNELREKNPHILPPRPPPPRSQSQEIGSKSWICIECRNENLPTVYDCQKCGIPGKLINPEESKICKCIYCSKD